MDAVKEYGGCPLKVRTDCGTENGRVAAAQCYFIGNDLAHVYGTSPHNRRIEGWWLYLRQHTTTSWINVFSRTYWNNKSSLLVMNHRGSACGSVFPD